MLELETILNGPKSEELYRDSNPTWRVGRKDELPQTAREAKRERLDRISRLEEWVALDEDVVGILRRLKSCRPERRCSSQACPECARAFQRWFVEACDRIVKRLACDMDIYTIVPPVRFRRRENYTGAMQKFTRKLINALQEAGVTTAIGMHDLSMNEYSDHAFESHYRPHLWVMMPREQASKADKILRQHFRKQKRIDRPVKRQQFNGDRRAFAYGSKTRWQRRVTYPKIVDENGEVTLRQFVKPRDLRVDQSIDVMLMIDELGFIGRMFLQGVRLANFGSHVDLKLSNTGKSRF